MTRGAVAVLAGRGKTGRAVSSALEVLGVRARPVGSELHRDPVGALSGAAAVYVVAPNMYADEPDYVAAVVGAAARAGVERVVYHSVAAPFLPDVPHHLGKARAEDIVRRGPLPWTVLQPCAYVQNFVPALRDDVPALRVPYDVDRPFGLVDLADVAEAAARVLVEDAHDGATYELGGPGHVSVRDVATVASDVLGVAVPVERQDPQAWVRGPGAGLGERQRAWLLAMFAYYDRHGLPAGSLPLRCLLDRAPTDLAATLRRELAVSR